MEVKSANVTLQLNRAATAVDNSGSEENNKRQPRKVVAVMPEENPGQEEESVKISISAAGMRKSKNMEALSNRENELMTESEIDDMMKKMEGLSSQVINGHFSMADRLSFQTEIKKLTMELNRLNGEGISFSKADNVQLSQQINELTRTINEAAVYHRSAKALFVVKNQPAAGVARTKLDIAI